MPKWLVLQTLTQPEPAFLRHVHGDAIRMRAYHETEAVVAIDGRGAHRGAHDFDFWIGIDVAFAEHANIAIETGNAMGIDAAEIRGSENVGCLGGILLRNTKMQENARTEIAQDFDRENFGLDGGHVSPFFEQMSLCKYLCASRSLSWNLRFPF